MPNLAAIQGFINAATRIVPVLEVIVGQITGLIGPLTTDVEAAIAAVMKAIGDVQAAFVGLEAAVKNAINPPTTPPAAS